MQSYLFFTTLLKLCIYVYIYGLSPASVGDRVRSLGQEDSLEQETATHSSILSWEICTMDRGAWQATVYGDTKESVMT